MAGIILSLKTDDLFNLKQIGQGTEGTVYLYKDDLLIKLYHKRIIHNPQNDEDEKIYKAGTKNSSSKSYYSYGLTYYRYDKENNDNVKLHPKGAIEKAIERQTDIELTTLPVGTVYLNGHFAGCLLKNQRGIQIHKLTGLPLNIRKRIYLNVLKAEAELLKNNVYHIDLSNSPFAKKQITLPNGELITTGHSHVLVNPFNLSTHFIDLEGKSTVYTEKENEYFEKQSLSDLNILTLEFLLQQEWEEFKEYPEEAGYEIKKTGISSKLQEKLIKQEASLEDLYELTKTLQK